MRSLSPASMLGDEVRGIVRAARRVNRRERLVWRVVAQSIPMVHATFLLLCAPAEVHSQILDGDLRDVDECRVPDSTPDRQGQSGIEDDPLSLPCTPPGRGPTPSGFNVAAIRAEFDQSGSGTYFIGIELAPGRVPFDADFDGDPVTLDPSLAGVPGCRFSDVGPEVYSVLLDIGNDGVFDVGFDLASFGGALPQDVIPTVRGGHPESDFEFDIGNVESGVPRGQPEFAVRNVLDSRKRDGTRFMSADFFRLGIRVVADALGDNSEADEAFGACEFVPRFCRDGTVNAGVGPVTDVLFVNGIEGSGNERKVYVRRLDPISIEMRRPPSVPATMAAPFALYAWTGEPNAHAESHVLPFGIGAACRGTPIGGGVDQPIVILNNTGREKTLGRPTRPSRPAPWSASLPGLGRTATLFLQGIIFDPGAAGWKHASVTNGIVLISR